MKYEFPDNAGAITATGNPESERIVRRAIVAGAKWIDSTRDSRTRPAVLLYSDGTADLAVDLTATIAAQFDAVPGNDLLASIIQHLHVIDRQGWDGYVRAIGRMNDRRAKGAN